MARQARERWRWSRIAPSGHRDGLDEASVRALLTIGFTALAAFVLVVALTSRLGRLIARSVDHVVRAATTLGKGGPLPSGETPVAEVDTLMGAPEVISDRLFMGKISRRNQPNRGRARSS
jgi:hypothetical protein